MSHWLWGLVLVVLILAGGFVAYAWRPEIDAVEAADPSSFDPAQVAKGARLAALGISGVQAEDFWMAVRGNLEKLSDAAIWWRILRQGPEAEPEISEKDREFLREAFDLLPPEPWDRDVWKTWTGQVKDKTKRKGKALFMPLRLASKGRHGVWSIRRRALKPAKVSRESASVPPASAASSAPAPSRTRSSRAP